MPGGDAYASGTRHLHPTISFDIPIGSEDALSADGDAFLTSDITLSSDIVIHGNMSLCLNGFDINMGSHSITIEAGGNLTVCDCPENPDGRFVIGSGEKPAIEVYGSCNIIGGKFVTEGRPIIFNHGETNISGGSLSGSDTQLVQTRGSGMLSVAWGEIIASGNGSAIAMIAAPEDVPPKPGEYNAVVTGGTILAGDGSPGTIVVSAPYGRFVLNTGANIVGSGCPAIKVEDGSLDAYGGAVVYSDSASAIVGTGGNISLYFATVTSEEKYGVDISEEAELLLSGSLEIVGGNAGVRLAEGKVFSMSDYGFYGDVRVSIHTDEIPTEGNPVAISTPCEAKHYSHFLSATPSSSITYKDRVIYNSYDGSVSHGHEGRNYILALNGSYTDLSKNNFYLDGDLSCNGFYTGSVVNICLNGHTLNLGSAIKMYPNSTLNIFDCQGGGKILANTTCIQDINGGGARVIVHQGTVLSNFGAPIKLSGDDTVIVRGGQIISAADGNCAIEIEGANNSVIVESGSIEGSASALKVVDGTVTVGGNPEGLIKGACGVYCTGFGQSCITADGNVNYESQTADIILSPGKLLAAAPELAAEEKISVLSEDSSDMIILSEASDTDISRFFESADSARTLMCAEENVIKLVRAIPASQDKTEINSGETAVLKAEYSGGGNASYQWYVRDLSGGDVQMDENGTSAEYSTSAQLQSGEYEFYCVVSDESGTFVSNSLKLTVKKDVIENLSVSSVAELSYTGEPVSPELNSTASTTLGRSVSFTYSIDGINYSESVPPIGPDAGYYTMYYIASAEGCDDVKGQISLEIKETEEPSLPVDPIRTALSPRLIAIIASCVILFVLCVIFAIQLIRKKLDDE